MITPAAIIQLLSSILLFTFNAYNPYFGLFFGLISPLFLVLYLDATKTRIPIELLVAIILYAIIFKIIALYYIIMVIIPSYFIVHKKGNIEITAGLIALFTIIGVLIFLPSVRNFLINNMESNIANYIASIKPNLSTEKLLYIEKIEKNRHYIATLFTYLMPSLAYGYIALITFINRRFFYRLKKIKSAPFQVPFQLIPIFVIGGFLILAKHPLAKIVSYNTLIIFFTLFFIQGIEIVEHLISKFKIPLLLKYLIYFFILIEPPITIIVAIFGLFDTWLDFRKINKGGEKDG